MSAAASKGDASVLVSPALDITSCDREPIHIPGAIQPHGLLFALEGPDLRVIGVSANAAEPLGHEPQMLLGHPLASIADAATVASVAAAAAQDAGSPKRVAAVSLHGARTGPLCGMAHATPGGVLLEVMLPQLAAAPEISASELFDRFNGATQRLQAAGSVAEICTRLAQEIRNQTGFDRVKVYRFGPEWNGEVVAEDSSGHLPSYLGLNFPASDIPAQARVLYAMNPERLIPDVDYRPVPFIQAGLTPIDLSQASLRSVSPIHIEYLKNMRVGASMSVSILRHGALWGLVACHHRAPHDVPAEVRQAAVLLAQLAAWQLALVEEAETTRRSVGVKAVGTMLLQEATNGRDHREALLRHSNGLLALLDASGMALSNGGSVTTVGQTPKEEELRELLSWLADRGPEVFETDHLGAHYPPGATLSEAAGVMAVTLGGAPGNLMVWFRPEIARTVTWGGDPAKRASPAAGVGRLHPRSSFAAWTEEVQGRARPWERHEVAAANGLRDTIVDIILRRSLDLEHMNAQLVRSNEELEAFAYVASHDLKEPLRQIETFGSLLERVFRDADRAKQPSSLNVSRWFDGIQASSQRLRLLINDLAEYSRLGRHANPLAPAGLGELLDNVRTDLGRMIEETRAVIQAGELPVVMCDRVQVQQVLQNVISNALKYRHPDRTPLIDISAETALADTSSQASLPHLLLRVSDNGIGFEDQHRERIFEPFQRLHSTDDYEGSGIGLAICRKIIERHGGGITASSRLGEGSTFTITLPLRPLQD